MLAEKYQDLPRDTHARLNGDGLIEVVSNTTGDVLALQRSHMDFISSNPEGFARHKLDDGTEVYVEKNLSLDKILPRKRWAFSWTIADILSQRISEGDKITRICKEPGMPDYATVCRWRREHSEFKNQLLEAAKDAAQLYFDEVMELVNTIVDDDTASIAEARARLLKWGAERGNPERFAARPSVTNLMAPVHLIIDTGVPQPKAIESRDVTPLREGGNNEQEEAKTETKKEEIVLRTSDNKE